MPTEDGAVHSHTAILARAASGVASTSAPPKPISLQYPAAQQGKAPVFDRLTADAQRKTSVFDRIAAEAQRQAVFLSLHTTSRHGLLSQNHISKIQDMMNLKRLKPQTCSYRRLVCRAVEASNGRCQCVLTTGRRALHGTPVVWVTPTPSRKSIGAPPA